MLAIKTENYLRPCLDRKRSNFCLKSFKTFLFRVETRFLRGKRVCNLLTASF